MMADKRAPSTSPDASGRASSQAPPKRQKIADGNATEPPIPQTPHPHGPNVPVTDRTSRKSTNSKRPAGETTLNFIKAPPTMAPLHPSPQRGYYGHSVPRRDLRFQAIRKSHAQQMMASSANSLGTVENPEASSAFPPIEASSAFPPIEAYSAFPPVEASSAYSSTETKTAVDGPADESANSAQVPHSKKASAFPTATPPASVHGSFHAPAAKEPIGTIPHNLMNNVTPSQLAAVPPGVTINDLLASIAATPSSGPGSAAALARAAIASTAPSSTSSAPPAAAGPHDPAPENCLAPLAAPDDQVLLSRSSLNLVFARLIAARKMSRSWIADADRAFETGNRTSFGVLSDVTLQARMIDMAIEQITTAAKDLRDGARPVVKYHELRDPDGRALGE